MSGYLLLTGGTGLLGRYLIRDLFFRGQKLALLVRSSKRESAQQRIESIMQFWEHESNRLLPRPVILEGDLLKPTLGLDAESIRWVARHCSEVVHSAASLVFHADGTGEPWTTNLEGTRNTLSLCEAACIRSLHYVSTAYVCGLRSGTILEAELDCGQEFRNEYEHSKLQAETLVRANSSIDKLTVYRPAVISGDSRTGYTNTYHGIYLYLRMMAMFVPHQPIDPNGARSVQLRLPSTGDERRNVVPVDWVSQVMTRLLLDPEAHGRTFHLAPNQCLTPRELIDGGCSYFNSTNVDFIGYQPIDPRTFNALEAQVLPGIAMYQEYESTDPHFDCTNLKRFAGDLPCPVIDEAILHKYLQFGEKDRWGKRRLKCPSFDSFAWDRLQRSCVWNIGLQPQGRAILGIDLIGPGGGQWTIVIDSEGEFACLPGLDDRSESLLRLKVADFVEIVGDSQNVSLQHTMNQLHALIKPAASPAIRERMTRTGIK